MLRKHPESISNPSQITELLGSVVTALSFIPRLCLFLKKKREGREHEKGEEGK